MSEKKNWKLQPGVNIAPEMVDEIHRRVATHGLAEMTINFASPEQLRAFGENVLPRV